MGPGDIRKALHANQPFKVRTADGKVVDVPHQDYAAMSPNGRTFIVMTEESWEMLDVRIIAAIEMPSVG